jgi:hypothetical protein
MAGKRLEDRFVLPGPKEPEWVCSFCNRSGNWASRTKCRCGKEAPSNLRQRSLEAAKKCSSSGKKSSSESVVASGGKGKALPREVDDRIKKLEQALADRVLMGERSLPASMSNQGSGVAPVAPASKAGSPLPWTSRPVWRDDPARVEESMAGVQ